MSAPRATEVRPEPNLDEFVQRAVDDAFRVIVRDHIPHVAGTVDCVRVVVTTAVPTGDGSYRVDDHRDIVDFTDGGLTLREALLLADRDGVDSTISLEPGELYQLESCDATRPRLRADRSDKITIAGNGAHVMQTCPATGVLIAAGPIEIVDTTVGPSSGTGIRARDVALRDGAVVANSVAVVATDQITIVDSRISRNGLGPNSTGLEGTIVGRSVRVEGSTVDSNRALYFGTIQSSDGATIVDSVISRNTSEFGSGAIHAGRIRLAGSVVRANDGRLGAVRAEDHLDVSSTTVVENVGTALEAITSDMQGSAIFGATGIPQGARSSRSPPPPER